MTEDRKERVFGAAAGPKNKIPPGSSDVCPECEGSGVGHPMTQDKCDTCNGTGKKPKQPIHGEYDDSLVVVKKCCWVCEHTRFEEGFTGAVKLCDLLPAAKVSIHTPITTMDCQGKDFQLKEGLTVD